MEKWDVVLCISTLLTTAALIVRPMLKLNTSIVKLNTTLDYLSAELKELKNKNTKTHEKIWKYCFTQDERLSDHEERILELEKKTI